MLIFPADFEFIGNIELYSSLKSMSENGILDRVLVICNEKFYNLFSPPLNNYILSNFKSINSVVRKIKDFQKVNKTTFTGIIAIDDEAQFELSKKIAEKFNLDFYNKDTSLKISSNKYYMKLRFQKESVPTSKFDLISNTKRIEPQNVTMVSYPNVLKLITGTGSEFIFKNKNAEELDDNITFLKKTLKGKRNDHRLRKISFVEDKKHFSINPRKEFLLEEFVGGDEYSCDFAIYKSTIKVFRVVKKIKSNFLGYFSGYYLLNEQSIKYYGIDLALLTDICRRISLSLCIDSGVCMVDFKVDNGEIKVIETAIRPGLNTFIPLMEKIYGYTSLVVLAKIKMGLQLNLKISENEGLSYHIFAKNPGRIRKFDVSRLQTLIDKLNIIDIHKYNEVGDIISDSEINHYGLFVGFVLMKNPQNNNITHIFELLEKNIDIIVEENFK